MNDASRALRRAAELALEFVDGLPEQILVPRRAGLRAGALASIGTDGLQ